MPTTKTITLYTFDELSDSAKDVARRWWTEQVFSDSSDWSATYYDADTIARLMGIEIDRRQYKTVGGRTGSEPAIRFSGFWSQGDGACFDGSYAYKAGSVAAVKGYAPQDEKLHTIVETLQQVQKPFLYKLKAKVKQSGRYTHSFCTDIEVYHGDDEYRDIGGAEADIKQALRDFMDWIYRQLEAEHEYQTSDEVVDENILCNEYTFTEDGNRED